MPDRSHNPAVSAVAAAAVLLAAACTLATARAAEADEVVRIAVSTGRLEVDVAFGDVEVPRHLGRHGGDDLLLDAADGQQAAADVAHYLNELGVA